MENRTKYLWERGSNIFIGAILEARAMLLSLTGKIATYETEFQIIPAHDSI